MYVHNESGRRVHLLEQTQEGMVVSEPWGGGRHHTEPASEFFAAHRAAEADEIEAANKPDEKEATKKGPEKDPTKTT